MDIQITVVNSDGFTVLGMPSTPKYLTGMDLLVQLVALKILKTFDQDVFDPKEGTDFRALIGQYNFAAGDVEEIRLMAIQGIKKVEQDIINEQGTNIGSTTERLKKLSVLDIAADEANGSVALRVQITNESGNVADIVV